MQFSKAFLYAFLVGNAANLCAHPSAVDNPNMPYAKKRAICPRGLENMDIRDVFKGYSPEGFEKATTDGETDLMNGFMRKPWGFYKGMDGIHYAVYAFKPEISDASKIVDTSFFSPFKMLRIKIPEYCALYTEDASAKKMGIVISRASRYKPTPVDPGGIKVEAVAQLIKNNMVMSGPMPAVAEAPATANTAVKDPSSSKKDGSDTTVFDALDDKDAPKDDVSTSSDTSSSDAPSSPSDIVDDVIAPIKKMASDAIDDLTGGDKKDEKKSTTKDKIDDEDDSMDPAGDDTEEDDDAMAALLG